MILGAAGVILSRPSLLLGSVVAVGYLAYVRAVTLPEVDVSVERSFDESNPDPGDEVGVTVTVRNRSDRVLPDLRVVDGVPDPLPVVEGSPRLGTAFRPGEAATMEYTVSAKRGEHEFAGATAIVRDYAGATERELTLDQPDVLECTPSVDPTREVPLRALTSRFTGRVETDDGGEGLEFFATREYRRGDTLNRIDWNRHARTGELATVEFRKERAATAVLVLDLREQAFLREDDEGLHAVDRGVDAASRVFTALLETGDRVGIAGVGPEEVWLPPGTGNEHWARARELFATHPALSSTVADGRTSVTLRTRRLRKRLSPDDQVIVFSPLCDRDVLRAARLLDAHGHLVTVISPDPTTEGTPGRDLARAERAARMADLRGSNIRVIDWAPDEHLSTAIDRAARRWTA
ncbi:DUF58 domain-containing protein [Halobacteriales archaeon QS_8_69_26]|nr:MAG: DUF58 domain-containing protein [Halobacteriales archaeon QS_8_69_26]